MTELKDKPKGPVLAACSECNHVWPFLWYPCPAKLMAKATPKICPWCGNADKKKIFMASRTRGDLDRYVKWLEGEIVRARAEAEETPPASALAVQLGT